MHGKWIPVATVSRVLRLRLGGRLPDMEVAASILNKKSQTSNKG